MPERRPRPNLAVPLLLCSACALPLDGWPEERDEPAIGELREPLIGGSIAHDDPAVVSLNSSAENSFCTGTLISPRIILTAAHCIDLAGSDPNIRAFFGTDVGGEGTLIGVDRKMQHPGWSGELGRYDIGMLRLRFAQDPFLPVRMNEVTLTGEHVGAELRHVGFGANTRNPVTADGWKRTGTSTITSVGNDIVMSSDEEVSVCFGDSGGPAFMTMGEDEGEVVAAVHSFTSGQSCNPPNGSTRVDLYVDDFIIPWIQEQDSTCGADGLCAPIGCVDDPDCTPCGPDGECVTDCPLPDPDCPTSELGEICQANSQCVSGLCVTWMNDSDYKFCTHECVPGGGNCPAGMSCQNRPGHGNICYFDEDPPGVLGDACEEPTDCGSYVCEDQICVKACNLAVGLTCPSGFECRGHENGVDYFCYALHLDQGGGCRAAGGGGAGAALLLGLLLAAGRHARVGRHRRGRPDTRGRLTASGC